MEESVSEEARETSVTTTTLSEGNFVVGQLDSRCQKPSGVNARVGNKNEIVFGLMGRRY